ncbi:MAG: hypothetical protein UX62_C0016G0005 [Microgenomates group bacterium GW2011_GWA2_46_7]|nr:MAG: hypothetical protein UX62_C0016G0005 [Microgenomates group bacterium GW2011_GWA2_46_7]
MSINHRRGIVIGVILVLLFLFYYIRSLSPITKEIPPRPSPSAEESVQNSPITKCQNVVVSPGTTVELFTYQSDSQTRYDYRVAAMSEEDAINLQVLTTGGYLYVWNQPHRYTNDPVPNPPGKKIKLAEFPFANTISALDQVIRFGASGFSGDKLCTLWDDVDPVFEVPRLVDFVEGDDTTQKLADDLAKICQICAKTPDDRLASTCRQNLSCQ